MIIYILMYACSFSIRNYMYSLFLYRGESFRKEFSNLGELRSLIPQTVHIMALTATATMRSRQSICKTLGMINTAVVSELPEKKNIKYVVCVDPGSLDVAFHPIVDEIRKHRENTDRTIIFCRSYDACARVYLYLKNKLGREFTNPVGAPDLAKFRLVDMFSACTQKDVKEAILTGMCAPYSHLRVIVATIAFGMGVDCPNIRRVIHWGPSGDVELYLQETGRAGRDMLPAKAILFHGGEGVVLKDVAEDMKEYGTNKIKCRREMLLKHFDNQFKRDPSINLCSCCDICEKHCSCNECSN